MSILALATAAPSDLARKNAEPKAVDEGELVAEALTYGVNGPTKASRTQGMTVRELM